MASSDVSFAHWIHAKRWPLFAVAIIAAIVWTIVFFQFTVDDAFISFRYGRILNTIHTWNWNPSGDRVEAYTSATYAALSILPAILHLSPALFFKFVGLLCIGLMIYRLRTMAKSQFAVIVGVLLIGVNPLVWIHSYSCLETPFYMLLILELGICVMKAPERASPYVYALCLLLPLTRPEGIVFSGVGLILFWHRRGNAPKYLSAFVLSVLCGIGYFLARWRYFHQLLPNPFYVKITHDSMDGLLSNMVLNLNEYKEYFFTFLLVLLLARTLYTRAFALCGLGLLLFLYAPHTMMMNYADRFYFQITLPILVFFFIAEDVVRISRITFIVAAVSLISISVTSATDMPHLLTYFPNLNEAHVDLGKKLAPFSRDHTLLIGDAGAVPYYSNWVTYDSAGLVTNIIAKNGINLPLLRYLHPDLIIVYSSDPSAALLANYTLRISPREDTILNYVRDSGEYEYAGASRWGHAYYLVEFLRKDTPERVPLLKALQQNTESSAKMNISWRELPFWKNLLFQRYVPWSE